MKTVTLLNGCTIDLDTIQYIMNDEQPQNGQFGKLRIKCDMAEVTLLFETTWELEGAKNIILKHLNEEEKEQPELENRKKQAIDAFAKFDKENCMGYGWYDRADIWWTAVRWADEHNALFQEL